MKIASDLYDRKEESTMRIRLLMISALTMAVAALHPAPQTRPIAITHITLIDGTGAAPRSDMTIVIRGGRFDVVRPGAPAPAGADVVDGTGRFAIPGLWDMHVHLTAATELAGPLFIANGVTGVRDCGGELEVVDWVRGRFASGALAGPRVFRAGPYIDGSKPGVADRIVISTEEEGRRAVGFLKERGVDFIKVHNGPAPAPYFALLAEARRQGLAVVGHIPLSVDPAQAIDAGHGSVEHIVSLFEGPMNRKVRELGMTQEQAVAEFTDEAAVDLAKRMVARGVWFDPTLIPYWTRSYQWDVRANPGPTLRYASASLQKYWETFPPLPNRPEVRSRMDRLYIRMAEITGLLHKQHVRILVGTDLAASYIIAGFSVHDELKLLVKAGLTPMEAILAATRNPAEALGHLADMGTVEKGKAADLVLLEANPLDDIANARKVVAVVADGRLYRKAALDELLEKVAADAPKR